MNWIGGARARAKLKEQSNVRGGRQQNNARNLAALLSDDEEEEEEEEDENVDNNDNIFRVPEDRNGEVSEGARKQKPAAKRKSGEGRSESCSRNVDYAALGYRLVKHEDDQHRVVPLLEFLETKIPNGQVLSLQLSHLLDITRVRTRRQEDAILARRCPTSITGTSPDTTDESSITSSDINFVPVPPHPPPAPSSSTRITGSPGMSDRVSASTGITGL